MALTASISACGDDDEPTAPVVASCAANPSIEISAGPTPTFTWSPDCAVSGLVVATVRYGYLEYWHIETRSAAGIQPGIRYGATPLGATVVVRATPLQAGEQYGAWTLVRGSDGRLYRDAVYDAFVP